MINLKINVLKIEKARLFKGNKGTYLDAVLIATPNSQYDQDYMIVQSVSKEERERGIKGPVIGNAKEMGSRQAKPQDAPQPKPSPEDEECPW
jgi:hypothetical protein